MRLRWWILTLAIVLCAAPAHAQTETTVTCPCSLWPDSAAPDFTDSGPDAAVELGLKFSPQVDGFVTAIRFYKSAANTETHVGNLWSAAGTLLGSTTFANETTSGWQVAQLPTPVAVVAGTTYVVSYHTSVGHYSYSFGY